MLRISSFNIRDETENKGFQLMKINQVDKEYYEKK